MTLTPFAVPFAHILKSSQSQSQKTHKMRIIPTILLVAILFKTGNSRSLTNRNGGMYNIKILNTYIKHIPEQNTLL